jgi:aromatic-L-amino-acid decarboxylase
LLCFRYNPDGNLDEDQLNRLNEELLNAMNQTGRIYIAHTRLKNRYTLRLMIGQTNTSMEHVEEAWQLLIEKSAELCKSDKANSR